MTKLRELVKAFGILFTIVFGLTISIYGGWMLAMKIIDMVKGI